MLFTALRDDEPEATMQNVEEPNIFYDAGTPREVHYRRNCFDSGGYIERDARRQNIQIQGVLGGGMTDNIAPYGDSHFKFNNLLHRTLAYSTPNQ